MTRNGRFLFYFIIPVFFVTFQQTNGTLTDRYAPCADKEYWRKHDE